MNGRLPQAAKEGPQCARIPGNVTASATLSDQVMELADVSWFGASLLSSPSKKVWLLNVLDSKNPDIDLRTWRIQGIYYSNGFPFFPR